MNAQTNHGRLSAADHVGHLLANAAQTSRAHVSCADRRLKLQRMTPRRSHSHPLSLVLCVRTFPCLSGAAHYIRIDMKYITSL